jgi:flavodoxin
MKALVVYESMYGNTAAVAAGIAEGIAECGIEVQARPVTDVSADDMAEADLLLVGGPTHAHGMSREATRKTAASDKKNAFPHPTVSPGLREWIDELPHGDGGLAAAFDTRIDKPVLLTGSAAKGIARRLQHRGFHLVAKPECFLVSSDNRLLDGEIYHARRWGNEVAAAVTESSRPASGSRRSKRGTGCAGCTAGRAGSPGSR